MYRIESLRMQLTTDPTSTWTKSNRAFFVHCEAGSDRTGEFSAAYVMRYKKYALAQALAWGSTVARRKIEWLSHNAVVWYCWYLTFDRGFSHLNCSDAGGN